MATASSGLPVTYTVTAGNATIIGSTLNITGLGPITITANQAGNASYAPAAPVTLSFTATQAVLTVTVGYYTRAEGAPNPTFTASIGGFVNGDANTPLVLTGAPIITTQATEASPPGAYPITPSVGTLTSTNYTFAFVPGELVVTQAPSYLITASPNALTIPIDKRARRCSMSRPSMAMKAPSPSVAVSFRLDSPVRSVLRPSISHSPRARQLRRA